MPTSLGEVVFQVDYTTRDYEGFRSDLLGLVPSFTPEWTDLYPSDPGVVLLEGMSYVGDVLGYYIDRIGNEAYLPTLVQRRSLLNIAAALDYRLRPATAAIVSMNFVCSGAGTLLPGDQVSTDPAVTGEDAVVFEVRDGATITGAGTWPVECVNGTSVSEVLGSGSAAPSQAFTLRSSPLVYYPDGTSSLRLFVDAGGGDVEWTEVSDFLSSQPTDEHYLVRIDENDRVTVIAGNGVQGKVFAAGTGNVSASYRIGGGELGSQVGRGQITRLRTPRPFVTSVTNPSAPQGGQAQESIDEAREAIPLSLRALDRAVTLDDYRVLAEKVGGVRQARAVYGRGPFETVVYVAAEGVDPVPGGSWDARTASGSGILGAVGVYLTPRKCCPRLLVRPISTASLVIRLRLSVRPRYFRDDVKALVAAAIQTWLATTEMGVELELSRLDEVIRAVPGVAGVKVDTFRRIPAARLVNPSPYDYSGTPDTTWTFGLSADATLLAQLQLDQFPTTQEVLRVTFLTPTTFRIEAPYRGLRVVGTVGSAVDVGAAPSVDTTVTAVAGFIPNYAGNVYDLYMPSGALDPVVVIGEHELAVLDENDLVFVDITGGIR